MSEKATWKTPTVAILAVSATAAGEKTYEAEQRQTTDEGKRTYAPSLNG